MFLPLWLVIGLATVLQLICMGLMFNMACPNEDTVQRHPWLCSRPARWLLIFLLPVPGVVCTFVLFCIAGAGMLIVWVFEAFVLERFEWYRVRQGLPAGN